MTFAVIDSQDSLIDDFHLIDFNTTMKSNMKLVSQENKNVYIEFMIKIWIDANFKNISLWEQFRDDFEKWIENDFKQDVFNHILRKIRDFLRKRDVWIMKNSKKIIIARSLYNTLQKEDPIEWTKDEIRRCMNTKLFTFNKIKNLIEIDFDRDSKNYFWRASRSRSRKSSTRERSTTRRIIAKIDKKMIDEINKLKKKKITRKNDDCILIINQIILIINQISIIIESIIISFSESATIILNS